MEVPRRRTIQAFAAATVLTTAGMLVTPTPTQAAWQDNVRTVSSDRTWQVARTHGAWMYGDSVTAADAPALAASLRAHELVLAWDATPGIPTAPAVDRLVERLHVSRPPARLVMALGTNDTDPRLVTSQVERVMDIVPPTTRVWWVNTWKQHWLVSGGEADLRAAAAVNAALAQADQRHRNLDVVDWSTTVGAEPRRYLRDGVHTLPTGRVARNALIVRAVTSWLPAPRPPSPAALGSTAPGSTQPAAGG
jgi:hypothetical protein